VGWDERKGEVHLGAKGEAVKAVGRPGRSLTAVAREVDVARSVLERWVKNFLRNEQLRRQLAKVKMERDILKKRWATSRQVRRDAFVARHRKIWPTRMMDQMLDVSTSDFYE
jgi:transposase-like protein